MSDSRKSAMDAANTLRAVVLPTAHGDWRFDITAHGMEGDTLYLLLGIDSYGWARTRERTEAKARKRIGKMRRRLLNLAQPGSVVT